jgi:hypothetical protein
MGMSGRRDFITASSVQDRASARLNTWHPVEMTIAVINSPAVGDCDKPIQCCASGRTGPGPRDGHSRRLFTADIGDTCRRHYERCRASWLHPLRRVDHQQTLWAAACERRLRTLTNR